MNCKMNEQHLARNVICRTVAIEDELNCFQLSFLLHTIKTVVIHLRRTRTREKKRAASLRGAGVTQCIFLLLVLVQLQANLRAHPLTEKSLSCSIGEVFSMPIYTPSMRSRSAEITAITYSFSHLAVLPSI